MNKVYVNITYIDTGKTHDHIMSFDTSQELLTQVMRCLTNKSDLMFTYVRFDKFGKLTQTKGTILIPYSVLSRTVITV